jgi:Reverse transcriptase (RNA-dependent DNA polymerase)/HNH endonuclease/Group II intron, maturase-specific domain
VQGKRRPLGIPSLVDRCLQGIVKTALEPCWEAQFEPTSYGFRPGRSAQDAIARIYVTANVNNRKKWVLDADIAGCFDQINHDFLLKQVGNFPARQLIADWLKAGYVERGEWHPTHSGTPQGGIISPLLANIVLHGMEPALGITRYAQGCVKKTVKRVIVRFHQLEHYIFWKLRRWISKTHPNKSFSWRDRRYWANHPAYPGSQWSFVDKDTGMVLYRIGYTRIQRHTLIQADASPDNPELQDYFEQRVKQSKQTAEYPKAVQRVILHQQAKCPNCGQSLFNGEDIHIHHKLPRHRGGTNHTSNLLAVHLVCHAQFHR